MQHHFTVPVPVDVAWSTLLDLERVAPCMPGATLTKADSDGFAGSVKVRLGPISLLYKGNGSFTEIDAEARRVVIDASGKDSRGNGTAAATVTAVLTPQGGSTSVQVDTDLKVTGKPAQLGRGMISDVAGKILGQFAECLAERLAGPSEPEQPAAETPAAEEPAAASAPGEGERAAASPSTSRTGTIPSWRVTSAAEESIDSSAVASAPPQQDAARPKAADDAIDLLSTAGVPVLKRVAPVAAAVAVVLFLVLRLRRRRRR